MSWHMYGVWVSVSTRRKACAPACVAGEAGWPTEVVASMLGLACPSCVNRECGVRPQAPPSAWACEAFKGRIQYPFETDCRLSRRSEAVVTWSSGARSRLASGASLPLECRVGRHVAGIHGTTDLIREAGTASRNQMPQSVFPVRV